MTVIDNLIALKDQYEQALPDAGTHAGHYREQLVHINALLVDQLLRSNDLNSTNFNSKTLRSSNGAVSSASQKSTQSISSAAIAAATPSKPKLPPSAAAPESRVSLPFLPAYEGMKKLDAITDVMETRLGEVVHQDEIIRTLYGELSPEALKVERLRMKAALIQGIKKKLWQKSPKPSSYILKTALTGGTPSRKGSRPQNPPKTPTPTPVPTPTAESKSSTSAPKTSVSQSAISTATGTTKRGSKSAARLSATGTKMMGAKIILPMHSDFDGLSKIDAVYKVMQENIGNAVHIDDIIQRLFGTLSDTEAKAEKVRMKDVMNRGRERGLWAKAKAPLSFFVGGAKATSASSSPSSAPKKPGRKAKTTTRKSASASSTAATKKPTKKQVELVALLRKADINV